MLKITDNASLRRLNTFGINATCDTLIEYTSAEDLADVKICGSFLNIGLGSNMLFVEPHYRGTVLHSQIADFEMLDDRTVRVGAGIEWDDTVARTVKMKLYGLENLSLIPGQTGSAAVQNIGAYGAEAGDRIVSVETYDIKNHKKVVFSHDDMHYGYRDSILKHRDMENFVVTHVVFRLDKKFEPVLTYGGLASHFPDRHALTADELRNTIIEVRRSKLPDPVVLGNAGSFFKNPVVSAEKAAALGAVYPAMPQFDVAGGVKLSAGWLIQEAGWKGKSLGRAGVYEKQALVLVNLGGATGADIETLAKAVTGDVNEKFGIELQPEVRFIY